MVRMHKETHWRTLAGGLWLGLLLMVAIVSLARSQRMAFDFHHFYLDGAYIWQHWEFNPSFDGVDPNDNRQLPFYLPVVPLVLGLVSAGGVAAAGVIFAGVHVGSLLVTVRVLWREMARWGTVDLAGPMLVLGALMAMSIYEAARYNQLSFVMLALLVLGCAALRKRPMLAGALFGLAAVIKLLPGILGVWLLLKRRWSAAGAMVATVVLVSIVPVAIAFGPARCVELHQEWLSYNFGSITGHGMSGQGFADHFVDHHNQSLAETLARTFRADHPAANPWQPMQLPAQAVQRVAQLMSGVLLIALLLMTRRPLKTLDDRQMWGEFAVYCLAMLIFSPLLRQYYFVWVLPAVLFFAADAMGAAKGNRRQRLGQIGLAIWLVANVLWPFDVFRNYGGHLLIFVVMALLLVIGAQRKLDSGEPTLRIQ
jgi:hypothetical protein